MVAGGMESMTNAPYILQKARSGQRLGHGEMSDHMFLDGLEDVYEKGTLMGVFAERTAKSYGFTERNRMSSQSVSPFSSKICNRGWKFQRRNYAGFLSES
ncbi:MAG: hypothetical protein CM1200mP28_15840 [Deltaproteobacteria bacterium]|nr:MAG: hypothetical protein CM1200mP28_15840 [Deltaproteobacteria bacterium]